MNPCYIETYLILQKQPVSSIHEHEYKRTCKSFFKQYLPNLHSPNLAFEIPLLVTDKRVAYTCNKNTTLQTHRAASALNVLGHNRTPVTTMPLHRTP